MIAASELIINPDGSVFHLHLRPGELAPTIILVGDPARVVAIADRFEKVELRRDNREFCSITGLCHGQRLSVVSTGIGCDNIDIVITELDALWNVDFATREVNSSHNSLTIIRLGTSGAVNPSIALGDILSSTTSIGIDGLAYFYADNDRVRNSVKEQDFIAKTQWNKNLARPYVVDNSEDLLARFDGFARRATTVSASGFYGPQGREVRLKLADNQYLAHIEAAGVDNFEMEGAAISFLGQMLGHKTLTICAIIAQRVAGDSKPDYQHYVDKLIDGTLDRLTKN
ncbi:MAG: nucleoside phosphorylase [Mucinivorans sp.]